MTTSLAAQRNFTVPPSSVIWRARYPNCHTPLRPISNHPPPITSNGTDLLSWMPADAASRTTPPPMPITVPVHRHSVHPGVGPHDTTS